MNEYSGRHWVAVAGLVCPEMPGPYEGERRVGFADRAGEWYAAQKSNLQHEDHGPFLTPMRAADFMAAWVMADRRKPRTLDLTAGVLCCVDTEGLVARRLKPDSIELLAWETEVWRCDTPDYMIDYDGQRYLGPREKG